MTEQSVFEVDLSGDRIIDSAESFVYLHREENGLSVVKLFMNPQITSDIAFKLLRVTKIASQVPLDNVTFRANLRRSTLKVKPVVVPVIDVVCWGEVIGVRQPYAIGVNLESVTKELHPHLYPYLYDFDQLLKNIQIKINHNTPLRHVALSRYNTSFDDTTGLLSITDIYPTIHFVEEEHWV